jgi:hypothetical protein
MLQIDINFPNPLDLLTQALEGNWVAWFGIAIFIVAFGMFVFLVILWLKLPDYAKKGFINNLVGKRPVVLEFFENKKISFLIPQMFRNGLAFFKGAWFIPPKLWVGEADLKGAERQALNAVYSGDGCPAGLYLNYSVQAQIFNPELVTIIEHEQIIQRLGKNDPVKVKKEIFQKALDYIKDEYVQLSPMHLDLPLNIEGLKTLLPQSLSKSQLAEQENRIRQDVRQQLGGVGQNTIVLLLLVVSIILGVVGLLKQFGLF